MRMRKNFLEAKICIYLADDAFDLRASAFSDMKKMNILSDHAMFRLF